MNVHTSYNMIFFQYNSNPAGWWFKSIKFNQSKHLFWTRTLKILSYLPINGVKIYWSKFFSLYNDIVLTLPIVIDNINKAKKNKLYVS